MDSKQKQKLGPVAIFKKNKNSSGDEIELNFLRRHRTCRSQRLRPLNRFPNFYYN